MGIREATGLAGFCTKVDFLRENTSKTIVLYWYVWFYRCNIFSKENFQNILDWKFPIKGKSSSCLNLCVLCRL